jgi:peptidyl-prolyl cis-trans isomerase D
MFDLFRRRDKNVRILLTILLGFVALSMVAYLIPGGPGAPGMAGNDTIIAEIGDEQLSMMEVQRTLQGALRGKQFPPEMLQNYVPTLVDQMIAERAVAYQAGRMGFTITEEELGNALRSMLGNILQGGFDKERYTAFLAQQNMTVADFEGNVRKQMLLTKLRNIVLEGVVVTPDEIETEYRRRNEKVKLDYISFSTESLKKQVTVSQDDLEKFFNTNKAAFRMPEKRSFEVLVANEEKIGASINLSDDDLRKLYASSLDRYRTGERVMARHILLMTQNKSADDTKKLEAKAADLLKQVKGGADFAEIAKKNSDDPGSAPKGGDLGWVTKGQMVPNFEATAFSLKKGEISNVIKTEYGFHIVQVTEREDARVKPFDEVKAELATESKKQLVFDRMQSSIEQARAALVKSPSSAAQLAQQFNLNHYVVQNAGSGDPIQEIGISAEFAGSMFGLQKGGVTGAVTAPGNKIAVGVLTGITPTRTADLAEVAEQVRAQVTEVKAREMLTAKSAEVARSMAEAGVDLAKLAKSLGGELKTTAEFGRDGAAEGIGDAAYFADAFVKPVGTIIGPVTMPEQVVIARVAAKVEADLSKLATEREGMVSALKGRKSQERKDLFEDGLVHRLVEQGKIKINTDAIKKLQNSYRS